MNAADESSPALSLRRLPFTVRLSAQLLNQILSERDKPAAPDEVSGLLFGVAEEGLVLAQSHRPFAPNAKGSGAADRFSQDKLFEQHLLASQKQAGAAPLKLVGWYAIRQAGGLSAADLAYHEWYFSRPEDLALILTPESPSGISLELYCRTVTGAITDSAYRAGFVRLSTAPLESPVEILPRPKIQDDFFMRAYEFGDAEETTAAPGWKGTLAVRYRNVFSRLRSSPPEPHGATPPAAPATAAPRQETKPEKREAPVPPPIPPPLPAPNLPAPARALSVSPPAPVFPVSTGTFGLRAPAPKSRTLWLPVLTAFLLTSGLTFGVVYYLRATDNLPPFLQSFALNPSLELKVEAQGTRLLLSWNRQSRAVRHARDGFLQIDDGSQRRRVTLDASQVANGSILYRPNSDDVTFRLEVHALDGRTVTESMRVLEGLRPAALDLSPDAPAAPPTRSEKAGSPPLPRTSVPQPRPAAAPPQNEPAAVVDNLQASAGNPAAAPPAAPAPQKTTELTKEEEALAVPEETPAQSPTAPVLEQPKAEPPRRPSPLANAPDTLQSYQPPKPVRQVLPNLSSLPTGLAAMGGQLEVLVNVDETGRVTAATPVQTARKMNAVLVQSALDAARLWRFTPATLHGKAVASRHSILFQFSPRR